MEIKRSVNKFSVVGTVEEINLKVDAEAKNKRDNRLVGCIAKADFKNPSVTIKVTDEDGKERIVGVNFMPTYKKKVSDGKVVDNPRYKALETIMGYEKGTRVVVEASVAENNYVNDQGEFKSFTDLNAFKMSSTNVPEEDVAEGKISGVIKKIVDEVRNEEETGRLNVEFYYFVTNADGDIETVPINLIVEEDLADDFRDMYEVGDNTVLDIEIVQKTVGDKKQEKEGRFGRKAKVVEGFTVTEFVVIGGDSTMEEEDDRFVSKKDIKKLLEARDVMIEAKKSEKSDGGSKKSEKKGLGNRKAKAEEIDDEDEDEEDPFQ